MVKLSLGSSMSSLGRSSSKLKGYEGDANGSSSTLGSSIRSFSKKITSSISRKGKARRRSIGGAYYTEEDMLQEDTSTCSTLPSPPRSDTQWLSADEQLPTISLDSPSRDSDNEKDGSVKRSIHGTKWKRSPTSPRSHLELTIMEGEVRCVEIDEKEGAERRDQIKNLVNPIYEEEEENWNYYGDDSKNDDEESASEESTEKSFELADLLAEPSESSVNEVGSDEQKLSMGEIHEELENNFHESKKSTDKFELPVKAGESSLQLKDLSLSLSSLNRGDASFRHNSSRSLARRSKPRRVYLEEGEMKSLLTSQRELKTWYGGDSLDGDGRSSHKATSRRTKRLNKSMSDRCRVSTSVASSSVVQTSVRPPLERRVSAGRLRRRRPARRRSHDSRVLSGYSASLLDTPRIKTVTWGENTILGESRMTW